MSVKNLVLKSVAASAAMTWWVLLKTRFSSDVTDCRGLVKAAVGKGSRRAGSTAIGHGLAESQHRPISDVPHRHALLRALFDVVMLVSLMMHVMP